MPIITIVVSDDASPSCVYIGDLDPRLAAHVCWHASQALDEEVEGLTVDRTFLITPDET